LPDKALPETKPTPPTLRREGDKGSYHLIPITGQQGKFGKNRSPPGLVLGNFSTDFRPPAFGVAVKGQAVARQGDLQRGVAGRPREVDS
jgi:hypothetical protein